MARTLGDTLSAGSAAGAVYLGKKRFDAYCLRRASTHTFATSYARHVAFLHGLRPFVAIGAAHVYESGAMSGLGKLGKMTRAGLETPSATCAFVDINDRIVGIFGK